MGDVVDIEELSAGWLSDVLGVEVRALTAEAVGAGQSGATYRLTLDAPEAPDLPPTLIAKVAAGEESDRNLVASGYRNEVGFYAEVLHTLDVRAPRCWHAAISDDWRRFTLLLEDLSPRVPGVQVEGCSAERAESAIRNLAGLHAPRWNDPTLHDLDFLSAPTVDTAPFMGAVAVAVTDTFLERYAADMTDEDVATLREAAAAVAAWLVAHPEPFSVVHGDYRLDNLMFGGDADDVVAVDWQTLTIAPPVRDVSYFLGTSLEPADRRAVEERLVASYHDALLDRGVEGYDRDRCYEDYRLGQIQGPLITTIGAAFVPVERTPAGDRMFLAMARRSCTAVRDLHTLDLL